MTHHCTMPRVFRNGVYSVEEPGGRRVMTSHLDNLCGEMTKPLSNRGFHLDGERYEQHFCRKCGTVYYINYGPVEAEGTET